MLKELVFKEALSDPKAVSIATHTLYREWYPGALQDISDSDKVRGDLSLQMISSALTNGHRVVVSDGGSCELFLQDLKKKFGNQIVFTETTGVGRGPQRRAAFEKASQLNGVKVIIYTQPEKASLIEKYSESIALPIIKGEADIVIPKRNTELFRESHPGYMYRSEIKVNSKYNSVLQNLGVLDKGKNLDWFFGPIVFSTDSRVLSLFLKKYEFLKSKEGIGARKYANPDNQSNAHYLPVVEALCSGLRVVSVDCPEYAYPQTQKENELSPVVAEKLAVRRRADRFGYLVEFLHLLHYLAGSPKSRLYLSR